MASPDSAGSIKIKPVQLGIRKGSMFMPLVLLLMAVLMFIIAVSGDGREKYLGGVLVPGSSLPWHDDKEIPIRVLDGPTDLNGYLAGDRKVTVCTEKACFIDGKFECSQTPGGDPFCKLKYSIQKESTRRAGFVDFSPGKTPSVMICDEKNECSLAKYPDCGPTPNDQSPCVMAFSKVDDGLRKGVSLSKDGWEKVVLPFMKLFLVQLGHDMKDIVRNLFSTTWQLALYSLIPGIAGLFYRRQFGLWFVATFGALLTINASGLFGSLTSAAPMPISGKLLLFLAVQALILLAIFRLQRHSQGLGALWAPLEYITPQWHNRILRWSLIAFGVGVVGYTIFVNVGIVTPNKSSLPLDLPVDAWLGGGMLGTLLKWELFFVGLPLVYSLFRNNSTWPSRRKKNIVICLDGTSNTPDQIEMGFIAHTNVYKLFDMLESDDNDKAYEPTREFDASLCKKYSVKVGNVDSEKHCEQISFYYAGVGNKFDNNPVLSVLGMGTGMGASEIVERAYLDLIRVYRPGDRVFITGFSRGAAIARLLARAIDARKSPRSVWTLYLFGKHRMLWMSKMRKEVPITVLGCWDTVGAFGVAKTIFGINFQSMNMGMDLTVPDNVQQAYHMVALDERRDSFEPTLMDPDPIRPERIVEVWFSGDHANIGGGWATDTLSDVTLDFLLSRISSGYANEKNKQPGDPGWGLYLRAVKADKQDVAVRESFAGAVPIVDPEAGGQIRQWVSRLYDYRPRTLLLHAVISDAVFQRMVQVKPAYAPESLAVLNKALAKQRLTVEEGVGEFQKTESMEPSEQRAVLEANRRLRLLRAAAYATDVKWKIAMRYDIPRLVEERKLSEVVRTKVLLRAAEVGWPSTTERIDRVIEEVTNTVIVDVVDRVSGPPVVLDNSYLHENKTEADMTIADQRKKVIESAIAGATSNEAIDMAVAKIVSGAGTLPEMIEKRGQLPATVGAGVVPASQPIT